MTTQSWLTSKHGRLYAIERYKDGTKHKSAAIIISGFGEPICDHEYFMSKLSRALVHNDCFVLQLDLFGHGNSSGNINKISFDIIQENINVAHSYVSTITDCDPIIISRGVMSSVIAELSESKMICINPFYPDKSLCIKYLVAQQHTDNYSLHLTTDESQIMYQLLRESNLIDCPAASPSFLDEVLLCEFKQLGTKLCLVATDNSLETWHPHCGWRLCTSVSSISLNEHPLWQVNAFRVISKFVIESDTYATAISNHK